MDIIKFFKDLATKWNEQKKCGFCWSFEAPLSESGMNATEISEDCCIQLFVTEYETDTGYSYNEKTNIPNGKHCDHIFSLYVVKPSNLGINTFSEIKGHPISESLWETILKPLKNCIGCGNEIDLCDMGFNFNILRWKMSVVKFKEDCNYVGWKIIGVFRENINL